VIGSATIRGENKVAKKFFLAVVAISVIALIGLAAFVIQL
jgi:hypothetical protein